MKSNRNSLVLYGRDESLLLTRQWILQSRGYRVLSLTKLEQFGSVPETPPIGLLLLCHSLSKDECEAAMVVARKRWPSIQSLRLDPETGRVPSGLLGNLLHTMEGPGKLVAAVDRSIGDPSRVLASSRP
ncbi:MAG TPA: hypothetical protein VGU46_03110 [Acidobacteriaceae bacterium]|nr:hypothetical protein [Acidobacteriaceae bacterium]